MMRGCPISCRSSCSLALVIGFSIEPARPAARRASRPCSIDKPAPGVSLPALDASAKGFSSADLKAGHVSIVNVWASWCVPCRIGSACARAGGSPQGRRALRHGLQGHAPEGARLPRRSRQSLSTHRSRRRRPRRNRMGHLRSARDVCDRRQRDRAAALSRPARGRRADENRAAGHRERRAAGRSLQPLGRTSRENLLGALPQNGDNAISKADAERPCPCRSAPAISLSQPSRCANHGRAPAHGTANCHRSDGISGGARCNIRSARIFQDREPAAKHDAAGAQARKAAFAPAKRLGSQLDIKV